eukprot:9045389-Alexandrium_andersonii.AAC.1
MFPRDYGQELLAVPPRPHPDHRPADVPGLKVALLDRHLGLHHGLVGANIEIRDLNPSVVVAELRHRRSIVV